MLATTPLHSDNSKAAALKCVCTLTDYWRLARTHVLDSAAPCIPACIIVPPLMTGLVALPVEGGGAGRARPTHRVF